MKAFVITGATSFLGRYILDVLEQTDFSVYAIVRPSSKNLKSLESYKRLNIVLADMDDTDNWTEKIKYADYFLHLGWDGVGAEGRKSLEIQEKNFSYTIKILKAAKAIGCSKFLFAGSQAEYGITDCIINEETPTNPLINYGKAKLKVLNAALPLAKEIGITYYHARIFSVYGIGDHPWTLVSTCVQKLLKGESVELSSCEQFWNFLYADDAAKEILQLVLSNGDSGVYNIASNDTRPLKSFINEIYSICDNKGKLLFGSYTPSEKPAELRPDISKLIDTIGDIKFTPFRDGISRIIKDYINR